MKKKLLYILGALLALLLIAYVVLIKGAGRIVVVTVNRLAPGIVQTGVTLGGASISPLSGNGTLTDLVVSNPPGWSSRPAFSLKKISVSTVPSSLFGDHIVINKIEIDGAEFSYETRVVASNIGDILKAIEGKGTSAQNDAKTKEGSTIKYVIKDFILKNAKVTVGAGPAAVVLAIPDTEIHDLGSQADGVTSSELALVITRTMLGTVVTTTVHAAGQMGSTMGAAAGDAVKNAAGALQGLFKH